MLLLATEIWRSHGGIQRYMRIVGSILEQNDPSFAALTLLDRSRDVPGRTFSGICCSGSKLRFCLRAALLTARSRDRMVIVGHVAMLPLVWLLHALGLIQRYAVILHGIEAWRRLGFLARAAARRADAIVATTKYTVQEFCYYNDVPAEKCAVIPLACAFPAAQSRASRDLSPLKLLTVTRLSVADAYKGVDTVLRAVRLAADQGFELRLDLVGDGDDRARLKELAANLGVSGKVHFWGAVDDAQLQRLLRDAHVFVLPSKKEGFGIVFLEAMAAGVPTIGANHGGTPEVIEHGSSGFLIEYGDYDAMVFYCKALADSPALYRQLSSAARHRATDTLSLAAMSASWESLLEGMRTGTALAEPAHSLAAASERN